MAEKSYVRKLLYEELEDLEEKRSDAKIKIGEHKREYEGWSKHLDQIESNILAIRDALGKIQ